MREEEEDDDAPLFPPFDAPLEMARLLAASARETSLLGPAPPPPPPSRRRTPPPALNPRANAREGNRPAIVVSRARAR